MDLYMLIQGGEIAEGNSQGFASDTWMYDYFNNKWILLNDVDKPLAVSRHISVSRAYCLSLCIFPARNQFATKQNNFTVSPSSPSSSSLCLPILWRCHRNL